MAKSTYYPDFSKSEVVEGALDIIFEEMLTSGMPKSEAYMTVSNWVTTLALRQNLSEKLEAVQKEDRSDTRAVNRG